MLAGFLLVLAGFLLVLAGFLGVLAGFLGVLAPFQFLWTLLTGWVVDPLKVLPQVTVNGEMWVCGIVALGLALWISDRFLCWLALQHPRLPSPWSFRSTLALTTFLLFFGASIAMTGIVHQCAWPLRSDTLVSDGFRPLRRAQLAENLNNVRQLKFGLDGYASDYDGRFPASLRALITDEGLDAESFNALLWREQASEPGEPWLYLGGGMKNSDDVNLSLLVQPRPGKDRRIIVLRVDGSAEAYHWEELPDDLKSLFPP